MFRRERGLSACSLNRYHAEVGSTWYAMRQTDFRPFGHSVLGLRLASTRAVPILAEGLLQAVVFTALEPDLGWVDRADGPIISRHEFFCERANEESIRDRETE
jgi:hypothetical protein